MALQILVLLIGFALLIGGANVFVNGSVAIAHKLKIPTVIVGLTIVAFGTSAPEAVITVTASLRGSNGLAIGNIVGSNIFNLVFIIGLCAVIKPVPVKLWEVAKDFWLSIAGAAILLVLLVVGGMAIPQLGSLLMLVIFAVYLGLLIRRAIKESSSTDEASTVQKPIIFHILLSIAGGALIIFGGHLTVESATEIAIGLGVSDRIIGLTVVAICTSAPELVTSLVACKKGENEFALGNIIGSNIFNILFILGLAGLISPLEIVDGLVIDTGFLLATSLLTLLFVYTRKVLSRREGIVMVVLYLGYIFYTLGGFNLWS